eukprot:6208793-Pleurochrysis_carterae.AAC.2
MNNVYKATVLTSLSLRLNQGASKRCAKAKTASDNTKQQTQTHSGRCLILDLAVFGNRPSSSCNQSFEPGVRGQELRDLCNAV